MQGEMHVIFHTKLHLGMFLREKISFKNSAISAIAILLCSYPSYTQQINIIRISVGLISV